MKHITLFIAFTFITAIAAAPRNVFAVEREAGEAAKISSFGGLLVDKRVMHLREYLKSNDSPIANEAHTFIREADRNNLDWRLVAAIAGTESTFGKHIPKNSYNAWGWGIPTGAQSGVGFKNWEEGIAAVSEGIRKNYIEKGAKSLEEIGRIYAASPAWPAHVGFFLKQINEFTPETPDSLDVNI
jgi:hypothetical protein